MIEIAEDTEHERRERHWNISQGITIGLWIATVLVFFVGETNWFLWFVGLSVLSFGISVVFLFRTSPKFR